MPDKRPHFSARYYASLPPAPVDGKDPALVEAYVHALERVYDEDTERVRARLSDHAMYDARMPANERRDLLRLLTKWRARAEGRDARWNAGGTSKGGRLKATVERDLARTTNKDPEPKWRE